MIDLIDPPPDRLDVSREDWHATPEVIRDEIHRMHRELSAGIEKYRPAAERDASLEQFHAVAKRNGKNLSDVMREYVGLETLLRTDFKAGFFALCNRIGLDPIDFLTVKANGVMLAHPMFFDAAVRFVHDGLPASTDAAQWHVGAMANEIEEVLPQCVARDASGFLMVDYNRLANAVVNGDWARAVVKGGLPYPTSGPVAYRYKYKSGVSADAVLIKTDEVA